MALNAQRRARLEKYIEGLRRRHMGVTAVFDVGTKAVRVLVAPKSPPREEWTRVTFYNDASVANLGSRLRPDLDLPVDGNEALEDVVGFMSDYVRFLGERGVAADDMHAVGTAIFRWMANQRTVVEHIKRRTGLSLQVLGAEQEAMLSHEAIRATYRLSQRRPADDFDYLLLLDQGGGSLEISISDRAGRVSRCASIDKLGSVYLRARFFEMGGPSAAAETRIAALKADVTERIAAWPGFSELEGARLLAYGMGSALAACLPRMHNFFMHNTVLTRDEINRRFLEASQVLEGKQAGELAEASDPEDADSELTVVYGIPVYQALMERLGLDAIRFAGYGLRYGVYLWIYARGRSLARFGETSAI